MEEKKESCGWKWRRKETNWFSAIILSAIEQWSIILSIFKSSKMTSDFTLWKNLFFFICIPPYSWHFSNSFGFLVHGIHSILMKTVRSFKHLNKHQFSRVVYGCITISLFFIVFFFQCWKLILKFIFFIFFCSSKELRIILVFSFVLFVCAKINIRCERRREREQKNENNLCLLLNFHFEFRPHCYHCFCCCCCFYWCRWLSK